MKPLQFQAEMLIIGINPYIPVTAEQAAQIKPDWRKPMPVLVQVNGEPEEPWRINMMPKGDGSFYLYLAGPVRKASNTGVGDVVDVKVWFDEKYHNGPMHPMPEWFAKALSENLQAKENWEKLIPSRKKEILRYFAALKSPEAKERNLERALGVLLGKPKRFMARSWKDGK